MKNRFWIYSAVLLLAVVSLWFRSKDSGAFQKSDSQELARLTYPKNSTNPLTEAVQVIDSSSTSNDLTSASTGGNESENRDKMFQQMIDAKNVSIDFYGKVIDQDGNPLSGVKIKTHVRQWYVQSFIGLNAEANFPKFEATTDANGLFSVQKAKGDVISIESIQKEGYELSSKTINGFNYVRGEVVTPENPAVYKMWKIMGAERLVVQHRNIRIPYDGTPVYFDLMKGIKVLPSEPSDIRVILLRNPLNVQRGGKQKYDWVATVDATNGGLIESNDEFMYFAPEVGYRSSLKIEMPINAPDWSPKKVISFYLKSRGNFGRVSLEFRTDSDREATGFTFDSLINPSGSRVLEYDSKQSLGPLPTEIQK